MAACKFEILDEPPTRFVKMPRLAPIENDDDRISSLASSKVSIDQSQSIATFADLFAGIGGFHYAASELGLQCVFACDIDNAARAQYQHNFDIYPDGDICEIDADAVPDHDVLFAGFPCQPFSIIGARAGMNDERGTLMFEIVRILKEKLPRVLVLENVRQFSTIQGGSVLERCIEEINHVGYGCKWTVLNALDFGLPQKRERTIIVGFADAQALERFEWPTEQARRQPLESVLEHNPDKKHFVSPRIRRKRKRAHKSEFQPSIWHENKGGNVSSHPYSCALRAGASHNYLLVDGIRRLTPREQLRLQGFPEQFEVIGNDSQIRRQVGNAVPVPMIRAVVKEVLRAAAST